MSNEIRILKGATFNYDFQPAKVDIREYDALVEKAEAVADRYDSLVFKNADLSEINLAHKELNSFIIGIEDSRKKVKKEYQKPLKEFERKIKAVVNKLDMPLQKIKVERDHIMSLQEQERAKALTDYIERKLKDTNIRIDDLVIDSSWTNKSVWTEKLNPREPLKKEINASIDLVKEENKKMIADRKVLETFLDDKGMEYEGWTSQLEFRDSLDIIKEIVKTNDQKKKAEAEAKAAKEAEASREPLKTAQDAIEVETEADTSKEIEAPAIDTFTHIEPVEVETVNDAILSQVIEIRTTEAKLILLDKFMKNNNIWYTPIEQKTKKVAADDELPF